jgi:hypothetical protein
VHPSIDLHPTSVMEIVELERFPASLSVLTDLRIGSFHIRFMIAQGKTAITDFILLV